MVRRRVVGLAGDTATNSNPESAKSAEYIPSAKPLASGVPSAVSCLATDEEQAQDDEEHSAGDLHHREHVGGARAGLDPAPVGEPEQEHQARAKSLAASGE